MSKKSGCKINQIMIKGKCRTVGKIPDKKVLIYYKNGEPNIKDKDMLNHPNYKDAEKTAIYVGEYMKKQLKKHPQMAPSPLSFQKILEKTEKKFDGEWFGSGGGFYHVLVEIDKNFNVVVDDQASNLYFTKKKMSASDRFGYPWEKTSSANTHVYEEK